MKVLIITYSYTPVLTPRAFRWAAIAERWVAQGHHVSALCAGGPGLRREESLNGVRVYRVGESLVGLFRNQFRRWASGARAERGQDDRTNRDGQAKAVVLAKWLHDRSWKRLYWPDYACLWYFPAQQAARKLVSANRYDAVISVSLPFTGHLVAMSLKRHQPELRWIVDTGDPFCFLEETPTNNHQLYRKLNYASEKKVFANASAVTVTTDATRQAYSEIFPESAAKIEVIPPLISFPQQAHTGIPVFPANEKIRLAFVGTLYKAIRSPDFLLALFKQLVAGHLGEKLELHFFGLVHDCSESFESCDLLGTKIFLHGVVSRDKAIQAMKEARVLVNIGNDTPYQLPSKLVEYATVGKPILNLIQRWDDSSVVFLRSHPAAYTLLQKAHLPEKEELLRLTKFIEQPPQIEARVLTAWLNNFQVVAVAADYERLISRVTSAHNCPE